MTLDTLQACAKFVGDNLEISTGRLRLLWHVGEPLTVPVAWYKKAHRILSDTLSEVELEFHFQSNGILINSDWIDFFSSDARIHVALSIDGPQGLHDAYRRTRNDKGTHAQAVGAAELLREAGVPFGCIAVVTEATLDDPDAFYDFFVQLGARNLAMNPETLLGANRSTTMSGQSVEQRYRRFLRRIADLHLIYDHFESREFERSEAQLRLREAGRSLSEGNRVNIPWRVVSFDWQGNVHTFSPELLGQDLPGIGASLGNVHRDDWRTIIESPSFLSLKGQVDAGVRRCRESCSYFDCCGGGSPANKWAEQGSFDVSETTLCRLGTQAVFDAYSGAFNTAGRWGSYADFN